MRETWFDPWVGTIPWGRDRLKGFPCDSAGKESAHNAGDLGSVPVLGRSPGEGKGYLPQYSGLENSMHCIVYGVAKSQTLLRDFQNVYYSSTDTHTSIKLAQAYPCFSFLAVNSVILEELFVYDLCENFPFPQVLWLDLQ